jgi:hypothetical protein
MERAAGVSLTAASYFVAHASRSRPENLFIKVAQQARAIFPGTGAILEARASKPKLTPHE